MAEFYKMVPTDWDFGTTDLSLEMEAALLRIINATHTHKAPVPDNDRVLAGLFRVSTRKARALVQALIDAGKLRREDGRLINDRSIRDLKQRGFISELRAECGAKGGRNRTACQDNTLNSLETPQAIASAREEKTKVEKKIEAAATRERENEADQLHAEVMAAVGLNGGTIPTHWLPPAATMHVWRWITDLGLTPVQVIEAARSSRAQHPEPPNGPKALDRVMRNLAATVKAPPMQPGDAGAHGASQQPPRIRARPPSQIPPRDTPESNQ